MAASKDKLIKQWIQYLKNNQIAALKSDPNTGQLNYKRAITSDDVSKFLTNNTDFSDKEISNAIRMVLTKKSQANAPGKLGAPKPGQEVSTWMHSEMTPGEKPPTDNAPAQSRQPATPRLPATAAQSSRRIPHDPKSVSDVEYKEVPNDGKPAKFKKRPTNEAIEDKPSQTIDEKDVETIFTMLASAKPVASKSAGEKTQQDKSAQQPATDQPAAQPDEAKQQEDTRKFIRIIRDTLTPAQRKMLWRALQSGKEDVTESQINAPDVKAVLKGVADLRANPTVFGKIPGFKKDKVNVSDLQKAWAEGDKDEGIPQYSDDTRDIKYILSKFGYNKNEINKVFSQVFGGPEDEPEEPSQSPAIQKLAEYAKTNGIDDVIISFMKREYGKELGLDQPASAKPGFFNKMFNRKAVAEEIRDIFAAIVNEERKDQPALIRQFQQVQLGRSKK